MSDREKLEKMKALIIKDKTYAFVLDYALFGSNSMHIMPEIGELLQK